MLTDKRKETIGRWTQAHFEQTLEDFNQQARYPKAGILNRLMRRLGFSPSSTKKQIGDLLVWSSTRGREFPVKAWDVDYYNVLANSEFVVCPNGDYTWTYRFFEATLCGAIPVIEDECDLYEGFRYFNMQDRPDKMKWNKEDALHNYKRSISMLTIPLQMLNEKIKEKLG